MAWFTDMLKPQVHHEALQGTSLPAVNMAVVHIRLVLKGRPYGHASFILLQQSHCKSSMRPAIASCCGGLPLHAARGCWSTRTVPKPCTTLRDAVNSHSWHTSAQLPQCSRGILPCYAKSLCIRRYLKKHKTLQCPMCGHGIQKTEGNCNHVM